jgi:sterol desaturase/sphingolipid hydroxylase (fatty acid hydroxylase superfamily)
MSPRDLAFVGCRLLALFVFVGVVQNIAFGVRFLFQALIRGPDETRAQQLTEVSLQHASAVTGVVLAAVLWFGAHWISGKIAEGAPQATGQWSPRIVLSVAIIFFGLYLLFWTLPHISYLLQNLVVHDAFSLESLLSILLQGAIAVGCILGSQRIADFIAKLRHW